MDQGPNDWMDALVKNANVSRTLEFGIPASVIYSFCYKYSLSPRRFMQHISGLFGLVEDFIHRQEQLFIVIDTRRVPIRIFNLWEEMLSELELEWTDPMLRSVVFTYRSFKFSYLQEIANRYRVSMEEVVEQEWRLFCLLDHVVEQHNAQIIISVGGEEKQLELISPPERLRDRIRERRDYFVWLFWMKMEGH